MGVRRADYMVRSMDEAQPGDRVVLPGLYGPASVNRTAAHQFTEEEIMSLYRAGLIGPNELSGLFKEIGHFFKKTVLPVAKIAIPAFGLGGKVVGAVLGKSFASKTIAGRFLSKGVVGAIGGNLKKTVQAVAPTSTVSASQPGAAGVTGAASGGPSEARVLDEAVYLTYENKTNDELMQLFGPDKGKYLVDARAGGYFRTALEYVTTGAWSGTGVNKPATQTGLLGALGTLATATDVMVKIRDRLAGQSMTPSERVAAAAQAGKEAGLDEGQIETLRSMILSGQQIGANVKNLGSSERDTSNMSGNGENVLAQLTGKGSGSGAAAGGISTGTLAMGAGALALLGIVIYLITRKGSRR